MTVTGVSCMPLLPPAWVVTGATVSILTWQVYSSVMPELNGYDQS